MKEKKCFRKGTNISMGESNTVVLHCIGTFNIIAPIHRYILSEKEKMLASNIISFSHNVFKSLVHHGLW